MTTQATKLLYLETKSEIEALLTEAELIKTYQPQFNILLKDDKSPIYIYITQEDYPRVKKIRKKDIIKQQILNKKTHYFGPFHSSYKINEVLNLSRKIFKWCDFPINQTSSLKGCFYYHIDQCAGACLGKINKTQYKSHINNLKKFLSGKVSKTKTALKNQMLQLAKKQKFEEAAKIRDSLKNLEIITHSSYKLKPTLTTPQLILDSNQDGLIYLRKILADFGLINIKYDLHKIEGFDASNISGQQATVSQVVFIDGQPSFEDYRVYYIQDNLDYDTTTINNKKQKPNDFAMIKAAILRRQNHPEWGMPNLMLIDGGKAQVKSAISSLRSFIPTIGIAKNPDRIVIPIIQKNQFTQPQQKENKTRSRKQENKNGLITYHTEKLDKNHPALKLLQQIRDEAHRFAKKHHKLRRTKKMFA